MYSTSYTDITRYTRIYSPFLVRIYLTDYQYLSLRYTQKRIRYIIQLKGRLKQIETIRFKNSTQIVVTPSVTVNPLKNHEKDHKNKSKARHNSLYKLLSLEK